MMQISEMRKLTEIIVRKALLSSTMAIAPDTKMMTIVRVASAMPKIKVPLTILGSFGSFIGRLLDDKQHGCLLLQDCRMPDGLGGSASGML